MNSGVSIAKCLSLATIYFTHSLNFLSLSLLSVATWCGLEDLKSKQM